MMVQKSDQKSEKDEKFEQLKKQASSLENSLKLSKDPTPLLEQFGEYLYELKTQPYGSSPHLIYFFDQMLSRLITVILKRNDLEDFIPGLKRFFSLVLECIVYLFSQGKSTVESMEILNKLFINSCPLYKTCQSIEEEDDIVSSQTTFSFCKKTTEWSFVYYNVECFGKLGGFKKIIEFVSQTEKLPLIFFRLLIGIITKIRTIFLEEFLENLYKTIQPLVFNSILRFSDEDFKNEGNSRKEIAEICNSLQIILFTIDPKASTEQIEKFFLEIALKCFRSPFLEKRLSGLNDMKDVISYLNVRSNSNKMEITQNLNAIEIHWITPEFLAKWIKENKILEQLYGENLHGELVKRSTDIPKFLASVGELEIAYLDLMWDSLKNKHETVIHIIYTVFGELSQSLSIEFLDYLFEEKIKKIPYSSYDYQTLFLIRLFSISAINASLQFKKKNWYGLDIFWDLFQDSNDKIVASDVSNHALSFLFDFLHWAHCHSQRVPFMERCIENIRKHDSVPQSLIILNRIISTYPEPISKKSDCVYSVIEWLESNYQILNLVFQDLVHYKNCSKEAASKLSSPTDLDSTVLYGTRNHRSQIKERLTFLEYILTHSSLMISIDQLNVFWACLVTNALTIEERELAFVWLENTRGSTLLSPAFNDDVTQYIFVSKIGELDYSSLTVAGFSFFEFFFRYVNWKNHKFEQTENSYFITSLDLIGMDKLWQIALEAQDSNVGQQAIALLNNMHKNLADHLKPFIGQQREQYIKICMSHLSDASKNPHSNELKIHRCLSLLRTFLDEFEPKTGVNHGASSKGNLLTLKMNFMGGTPFELEVFSNDTVKQLKNEVSKKVNSPTNHFRLITAGKELVEDDITLQAARLTSGQTIVIMKRPSPKPLPENSSQPNIQASDNEIAPSKILSRQEYFNQLFDLLNLSTIAQQVWDLLMLLPTNQKLFEGMYALEGIDPSNPNWNSLLSTNSTFKLYYSLQIIDSFLEKRLENENLDTTKWRENFLSFKGLIHLFNILLTNNFQDKSKGSKEKSCLALILKIINFLLTEQMSSTFNKDLLAQSVDLNSLIIKLLEIIWFAAIPALESSNTNSQSFVHPDSIAVPNTDDINTVDQSLNLLSNVIQFFPNLFLSMVQRPSFSQWLWDTSLCSFEKLIRENVVETLYKISNFTINSEILPHSFFLDLLLQFLPKLTINLTSCEQYFSFLCKLVSDACKGKDGKKSTDFANLLIQIVEMIKQHPIVETRDLQKEDTLLRGLMQLCLTIIKEDESFKLEVGSLNKKGLIIHIFEKCLFDIPTKDNHNSTAPPKCKTLKSRKVAFLLLTELAKNCSENFMELTSYLLTHFSDSKKPGWSYLPSAFEKSQSGYVGLKNLGATCYMNSLMQQLYNIPQFRYGIFSTPLKEEDESNEEKFKDNVLFQIQSLLSHLQESEKKYYDTQDFCKAYKYEGQPINPTVQMDADEFFNMLFDKLESLSKGTPQEKLCRQFFGGEFANQIISKECDHISEKEENFFTISLEVKNKKNILESLELFTHGDVLDGENKYFCSSCNKKVDALKRTCVKALPDVLILHAKRFEFDLETMRRTKVNDYCEFPHQLNMFPFTKEGLMSKENSQLNVEVRDSSYYQYQLSGILVHTGTADSGHYYSFIRQRSGTNEGKWFQFNDSEVEPFDSNEIPAQAFGGMETVPQWDPTQQRHVSQVVPKIYSAYMLFYDRVKPIHLKKDTILKAEEESKLVPKYIFDKIWEENMTFLRDKNFFDPNYFQFVWDVVSINFQFPPVLDYNSDIYDALRRSIEVGTRFIFTILAYAKEKQNLREYVERLKQMYSNHIPACKWFLTTLINQKEVPWLKSILFQCPINETREILSRLITHVISCLVSFEKSLYVQFTSDPMDVDSKKEDFTTMVIEQENPFDNPPKFISASCNIRVIETLLFMLKDAALFWRNFAQYFLIFREFASFGTEEKQYLLSRNVISQFIDFYLAEDSPYAKFTQKQKRPKMGDKLKSPNLAYMLDFIGLMVRSCETFSPETPPSQLPGTKLRLSNIDQEMVFYSKTLRENIAPKAVSVIVNHLCWENENYSNTIIEVCTSGINSVDHDKFAPYFEVLTSLLNLQDSLHMKRVDRILSSFLKVIDSNLKFKNATYYSVKYLLDISNLDFVTEWLVNHKEKWIENLLIEHTEEHIREITSKLIQALVSKYPPLPEERDFKIPMEIDIPPETLQRVYDLYLFLLSFIPSLIHHIQVEADQNKMLEDTGIWKLVQYFRLTRWFAKGTTEKLKFGQYYSHFYHLFDTMDQLHYTCDENKCELMYFWNHMVTDCPENLNLISEKSINRILDFFVSISPVLRFKQYNQYGLTPFYNIIYLLCLKDSRYLQKIMNHTNFDWAVKFMYLESQEYPSVASLLFKMLSLCCSSSEFRQKYITSLLIHSRFEAAKIHHLKFLDILLVNLPDFLSFCVHEGVQKLSQFLESRNERECEIETILALGLKIFSKATSWMIDPEKREIYLTLNQKSLQSWNSSLKLSLLTTSISLCKHYQNHLPIFEASLNVIMILSVLDESCFNSCYQFILTSFSSGFINSFNISLFKLVIQKLCDPYILKIEPSRLQLMINLCLEFIKRNINDSNLGVHGLTLLQNLIQGIPENNSSIIYNNPILKEVILQVLSIYNFHLLQPEIETIVKNIFNKIYQSLTNQDKEVIISNLNTNLINLINFASHGDPQNFLNNSISTLKALFITASKDLEVYQRNKLKIKELTENQIFNSDQTIQNLLKELEEILQQSL